MTLERKKMMSLKKCIATSVLLLMFAWMPAWATQAVGTVINLSGPLLAKKQDGTVKVLAQKSSVEQGDTLVSEKNTYARIKFVDNSEITLRPNSQFKIESFSFNEEKPENDSAFFKLVKGGLRAVTGQLGKRSKERFGLNTPTATIGIRGTIFIAEYIPDEQPSLAAYGSAHFAAAASSDKLQMFLKNNESTERVSVSDATPLPLLAQAAPGLSAGSNGLAPGLYVQVLDGMIHLSNTGGAQNFAAGQFGYTASLTQPPIVLPSNPGIQFTPPPAFSTSASHLQGGNTNKSSGTVDCEVR